MILILTQGFPPDTGGHETLMGGLARSLSEAGRMVTVLADHIRNRDTELSALPFELQRFGGLRPFRRWRKAQSAQRIARANITAVFCDSWKSLEILPAIDAPVAVLAHGMELPTKASPSKTRRIQSSLEKANVVIANSAFTADRVRPYLVATGPKVVIVHPPVSAQPQASKTAIDSLRQQLDAKGPILTTLARLEPRKGIDQVLRSLPRLRLRWPDLRYAIAGAGADQARLEALAGTLGVDQAVRFLGRIDESTKAALLSITDVFAMPVRQEGRSVEGFGISYIEAAWYGVAALAGREGGASDAVLDEETGLLCNGSDLAEVHSALDRLLEAPDLRAKLGAAAQTRARAMTWQRGTPYLAALLGGLAADRQGQAL